MAIRVVLAEDNLLVREGVRRLLETRKDANVEVVGSYGDLDSLLAAVTQEAKRRNRLPSSPTRAKVLAGATRLSRQVPAQDGANSLTKGQLNAVRAAFKAGVAPSTIARQFRISQSVVRKALTSEHDPRFGR